MNKRKHLNPEKKVEILREILDNKLSISDAAEKYQIHPNQLSRWKKRLFEGALQTFSSKSDKESKGQNRKINRLEEKLRERESLITELATENLHLKKNISGDI